MRKLLLFTPFSATRFAMPMNSNLFITIKKATYAPKKILGHSMQLIQSSTITLLPSVPQLTPDHSAEPSPSRIAL